MGSRSNPPPGKTAICAECGKKRRCRAHTYSNVRKRMLCQECALRPAVQEEMPWERRKK